MVAQLATKADFTKALADAGSKLVAQHGETPRPERQSRSPPARARRPAGPRGSGAGLRLPWPGRAAQRPHVPISLPLTVQVVVDFTATWCGPCQRIAPVFTALAEENPEVCFVKVDVDENEEVAQECGVESMPTFQFYKSGLKVHEFSGASEDKIKGAIAQFK
jgi:thioredoxin